MPRDVDTTIGLPGNPKKITVKVVEGEPDPIPVDAKLNVIGHPAPRIDAREKVTGRARYTYDVKLPGMLHARVLRCPHPAAKIVSVSSDAAKRLAGVRAVISLEGRTARYAGDEVAAVAAISPAVAADAIGLIEVHYEPRPWVTDTDRAREPGSNQVFDGESNARPPNVRTKGNVADAMKQSAVRVDRTFRTQVQTHACLETHGVVASWEGSRLKVWASTQGTFSVRDGLAEALGIPKSDVTVITDHMGGGFGSKFGPGSFAVLAARLAKQAKAPVKLMLSRKEEHLATGNRPDSVMRLKAGGSREGKLLALDLSSYGTPGIGSGAGVSGPIRNVYSCENVRTSEQDVWTNTGPAAPMRAPGHPQGSFALESVMDELAERLGIDPLELRRRNDTNPVRLAQYDIGAREIGWSRRKSPATRDTGAVKSGIGMGCAVWYNFGGPGSAVHVRIGRDGSVEVLNGAQDIGTGTKTIAAMIVAEELGLPIGAISVRYGTTEHPFGPASGGSTTTPSLAPAVRAAAAAARRKIIEIAAPLLSVAPEDAGGLSLRNGRVISDGGKSLSFGEVAARIPGDTLTAQGERASNDTEGFSPFIAGVQFAEVEVDTRTGRIRVLRVVAVQDCGRVLNPLLARSQINGGIIQGLSWALYEDRILDPVTGRMINANLEQYKIAGAMEIPEIVSIPHSVPAGFNNLGALGLGEPPVVPTAAAIANAVANATGVRLFRLPMAPWSVLEALGKKQETGRA